MFNAMRMKLLMLVVFACTVCVTLAVWNRDSLAQGTQLQQGSLPPFFTVGNVITDGPFDSEGNFVWEIKELSGQWIRVKLIRSRHGEARNSIGKEMWLNPNGEIWRQANR